MRITKILLASASLAVLGAASVVAQPAEPDTVADVITVTGSPSTFGAMKSDTPIVETARSVSIETEDMFIAKGALTLDDVLNYTAGVTGEAYGFATRGDFYFVRGLNAPEYRDNIQSLFGNYNNTRPEIYTLEQVEVLKGPASVLFGQGSPGGLVNTVSKIAGPDLDSEIVASYGSFDRAQIALDYNLALSDTVFARAVALYRDADTQVDFVEDDALVLAPSLTWTPSEDTSVTLLVNYDERTGDVAHQFLPLTGTLLPAAERIESSTYLGEPGFNRYDTESTAVTVMGSHRLSEVFTLEGTARWRDGSSDYSQSWIAFAGAGNPRIDAAGDGLRSWYDNPATSEQLAADLRLRAEFATGGLDHEVLIGVNAQDIELTQSRAFLRQGTLNAFNPVYGDGVPTAAELDAVRGASQTSTDYVGLYVNDQIEVGALRLTAGLRYDEVSNQTGGVSQDDDKLTFAAGALYAFDNGLSPYISYAESFEPVVGTDAFTSAQLKPREGEQVEIGVKFQPNASTLVTLAWFDIEQSNLPNPAGLPTAPSQQEGVSTISGLEVEALTAFDTGLGAATFEANFSVLDGEDPNGLPLASVPETLASVWGTIRPDALAGLRLGLGARYLGENESNAGGGVRVVTGSATLLDALIAYDWADYSVQLNVRNLADEDYYATCLARGDCFPGEERSVNLRLSRSF
ncbi:MAG: TonB-dependent siderophore receptor [Oceanicaulis sp.]